MSHTFEISLQICEGGYVSARAVNFGPPGVALGPRGQMLAHGAPSGLSQIDSPPRLRFPDFPHLTYCVESPDWPPPIYQRSTAPGLMVAKGRFVESQRENRQCGAAIVANTSPSPNSTN